MATFRGDETVFVHGSVLRDFWRRRNKNCNTQLSDRPTLVPFCRRPHPPFKKKKSVRMVFCFSNKKQSVESDGSAIDPAYTCNIDWTFSGLYLFLFSWIFLTKWLVKKEEDYGKPSAEQSWPVCWMQLECWLLSKYKWTDRVILCPPIITDNRWRSLYGSFIVRLLVRLLVVCWF